MPEDGGDDFGCRDNFVRGDGRDAQIGRLYTGSRFNNGWHFNKGWRRFND